MNSSYLVTFFPTALILIQTVHALYLDSLVAPVSSISSFPNSFLYLLCQINFAPLFLWVITILNNPKRFALLLIPICESIKHFCSPIYSFPQKKHIRNHSYHWFALGVGIKMTWEWFIKCRFLGITLDLLKWNLQGWDPARLMHLKLYLFSSAAFELPSRFQLAFSHWLIGSIRSGHVPHHPLPTAGHSWFSASAHALTFARKAFPTLLPV